jgi:transcription elongation factor S-II
MGIYNATLEDAKHRLVPLTWEHETFRWIYNMIAKRTISNFQPDSYVKNESLIQRWKEGEFTLDALGKWTPYELKPTHWKDLKDQQFRREQRILEGNLSMATDRFRCSQCKKKMCSYYELQTRSADEPMTIFIRCLNCGKQWKQ